ncbi:MAG: outer membrane beta-barrel protein [Alphaproteobacteria bacterium]|nr:outer membrane beta-barrel protein [Alphaproteobacteria bacterium]
MKYILTFFLFFIPVTSFAGGSDTIAIYQKPSLEIAGGVTTFGSNFKGEGYKMKQIYSPIVRIGINKKIDHQREFALLLTDQWNGRAKTSYVAGVSSNIHHAIAKFHTASMLATYRYSANIQDGFVPYISASIGFAVNSLKEIHTGDSAKSDYQRKTIIQPAFGVGIGGKYQINKSTKIFAEYQYLDSGKIKTSSVVHTNGTYTSGQLKHKLRQNLIFLGTEFNF